MELWPWLWTDFCTYAMGSPEAFHLKYFISRIGEQSTVLDIGAYIGVYALNAGRIATRGAVHAFEPDPRSAARLADAIESNNLRNVHLCQAAVGDRSGEQELALEEYPPTSSLQHDFGPGPPEDRGHTATVRTLAIDEYCSSHGIDHVAVIKIDVEGAELYVLQGATDTIIRSRPELIVELHAKQAERFGYDVQDVVNLLRGLDYSLFTIQRGLVRSDLLPFDHWEDLGEQRKIVIARPN